MPGTKIGWVAARQTMKEMSYLKDSLFTMSEQTKREILNNQEIWTLTLGYLQKIDRDFDEWYSSDAVPEIIIWKGEEFQSVLGKLWNRIYIIKTGAINEKATPEQHGKSGTVCEGSFIQLWSK